MAGSTSPDLSVLAGVPGITYRDGDRVVRNPDRDRIADLNTLPSPFLTGLFDVYAGVPELFVTLETNRGCPYSCTFCDWGSATASRVRQFDIERVFARARMVLDGRRDVGIGRGRELRHVQARRRDRTEGRRPATRDRASAVRSA